MHRLVLRPLLIFVTLTMLVVALLQSVGRLACMALDDMEPVVNQWLSGQHIRVSGLRGTWRYLNPVVSVRRVDLPAGYLEDLVVEFDWLESLVRNRFVTRRLANGDAELTAERAPDGRWQLVGSGGGTFDPSGILYHSDELHLNGAIVLRRSGREAAPPLRIELVATNRGGVHRHRVELRNTGPDCAAPSCRARFDYQQREGLWPLWEESAQLLVVAEQLRLPSAVIGVSALDVTTLGVRWHQRDGRSGGVVNMGVNGLRLPGGVVLGGELRAFEEGEGNMHHAVVDRLVVHQSGVADDGQNRTLRLPLLRLRSDEDLTEFWAARADLSEVADFLRTALRGIDAPSRWLGALDVRADATNVRGFFRSASGEFGYACTLSDLALDGYKGAPFIRGGSGELVGHNRGVQLRLGGENMLLQFPTVYTDRWRMPYLQGVVQAWFGNGYMGMRGTDLRAETPVTSASGSFAISHPAGERFEERLTILINVDALDIQQAKRYVPYTLSPALREWLHSAPQAGLLTGTRFGYHGSNHLRPGEIARRVELTAHISDGRVRYHDQWPEVTGLFGKLVLAGPQVRVDVEQGSSAGARLAGTTVILGENAAFADVALAADIDTGAALDFVRETPVRDWLTFVDADWSGGGRLGVDGNIYLPLADPDGELGLDLSVALRDADLHMPDLRLEMGHLDGRLRYRYPSWINASGITGELFGNPLEVNAYSGDDAVTLQLSGRADHEDVLRLLDVADPGIAHGSAAFDAGLHIGTVAGVVTRLSVRSDLQGVQLDLPGEFRKDAAVSRPLELNVQFVGDYQAVSFVHGSADGWLHLDDGPVRGAIGFHQKPPMVDSALDHVVLSGWLDGFALEEVVPDGGGDAGAGVRLQLADLRVGSVDVGTFRIENVTLGGEVAGSQFAVDLASEMVAGKLRMEPDRPLMVNLDHVVLPQSSGAGDPLEPSIIPELPAALVEVRELRVGNDDYGSWRFDLVPVDDGILLNGLEAQLRGVSIAAPDGVRWHASSNRSSFRGELRAVDMADVLDAWNYAPSLETGSASLSGELAWAGSPANVALARLEGEAAVRAEQGRFVDVESGGGAMRIFSLMNFNTIAKRMRGDFSDVTGKGVAFNTLEAKVRFDRGLLEFTEPMQVSGTGSRFELAGTVNLVDGTLHNEMIVTLPVSSGLPWYAAYVALANPLAGAGILVGERVLRKPIEQFSSAKYLIEGTLEDPQVSLVRVFDTTVDDDEIVGSDGNEPADAQAPTQSVETGQGPAAASNDDVVSAGDEQP